MTDTELLDALLSGFYESGDSIAWGYIEGTPLSSVTGKAAADEILHRFRAKQRVTEARKRWDGIIAAAAEAGIPEEEFWDMTPRELSSRLSADGV